LQVKNCSSRHTEGRYVVCASLQMLLFSSEYGTHVKIVLFWFSRLFVLFEIFTLKKRRLWEQKMIFDLDLRSRSFKKNIWSWSDLKSFFEKMILIWSEITFKMIFPMSEFLRPTFKITSVAWFFSSYATVNDVLVDVLEEAADWLLIKYAHVVDIIWRHAGEYVMIIATLSSNWQGD
jgi:hypothetical protein